MDNASARKGEIMDKNFEKEICERYFCKDNRERIFYELTSKKKRSIAIDRFSHQSSIYLNPKSILHSSNMLFSIDRVKDFLECKKCYCICSNSDFDGRIVDINDVLNSIYSVGPYFIFNTNMNKGFLETEYNFSEHYSYLLQANNQYHNGD